MAATSCCLRFGRGHRRAQGLSPRGLRRTLPCEETARATPEEGPEGADTRVRELKDKLELELLQQGEEQYECLLKRKEQHLAEVPGWGRGGADNQPHALRITKGFTLSPSPKPILTLPSANRQDDGAGQRETGCRA